MRSTSCESPSYEAHNVVETRAVVIGREAFEEMFVASRPKFVAMARAILRNREDAVQNAFIFWVSPLAEFRGSICAEDLVYAHRTERENLQLIDGILGKMKPLLRQAFTMTYYDELSGPEACAVLGVSAGTFKARLFRAKRQLWNQAQWALVVPIHKTTLSASEFSKLK